MSKVLVWDIPTRLFHWAFALSLTAAIAIGFLVDEDQPLFQLHMLFGITAVFLVALRVVMGLVGSRYSRFRSYPLHPRKLAAYLISAVMARTERHAGNNPGSAMAAVLMFLLVPSLFVSGIGIGGEEFEELHEVFAWALLSVIFMHLAGLAWHTLRHRENISLSMITGKKSGPPEKGISSANPVWGTVMLLVAGGWITALFSSHNPKTGTVELPAIGVTLSLGEHESDGGKSEHGHHDDD